MHASASYRAAPPRRKGLPRWFVVLSILVTIVWVARCVGGRETPTSSATTTTTPAAVAPTPTAPPPMNVSARQLYVDYQANEVSADEKYKSRSLLVTGTVTGIDKDAFGGMVIRLASGDGLGVDDVLASLDDSQKRQAMALSKGKQVSVLCKGTGMTLGSPTLGGCRLQ